MTGPCGLITGLCHPRVEHFGDIRVVHQREGLPFGLEAGDHLSRVHPGLDDLEGDLALHRPFLLGQEDDAEAAFTDLLHQFVRTNLRAGRLGDVGRWFGCVAAKEVALRREADANASRRRARYLPSAFALVIFVPCRLTPPISPFWPNATP